MVDGYSESLNVEDINGSGKDLQSIPHIRPLYFLPADPFVQEILIPGFQSAEKVDCMVGFFSSAILTTLAPGLASYINTTNSSLRLIISPHVRAEDQTAIEEGVKTAEEVASEAIEELIITEDTLAQHTLKCLAYLLRTGRIEIRVALMKNALFHPKVWIFKGHGNVLTAHGSSNLTSNGIENNFEQISISKSWEDPNQEYITSKQQGQFANLWQGKQDACRVVSLPQAVKENILRQYSTKEPPTEEDFLRLYNEQIPKSADDSAEQYNDGPRPLNEFHIPEYLQFESGPFEHQGRAVEAWCGTGYRGVLEMATGSGKTITAMICAHRLYKKTNPLLIVVSAPYVPLVQQWCGEIELFGLQPVDLTSVAGPSGRARRLNRIRRQFRHGSRDVEAVVVSHRTLCSDKFKQELHKFNSPLLLIADEVHNLGSEGFIDDPPTFIDYRLGLSATPVRQYDSEGTDKLFSFFGSSLFSVSDGVDQIADSLNEGNLAAELHTAFENVGYTSASESVVSQQGDEEWLIAGDGQRFIAHKEGDNLHISISVVFQFTLEEAIGRCLVEYDYFVHPVKLTPDEMDEWYDLTAKIKANAWRQEHGEPDDYLESLFRERRVLLETAENKLEALRTALQKEGLDSLRHTLIYASDKAPKQLQDVNKLLKQEGVLFHQITDEETDRPKETSRIIGSFQDGTLGVLTAKRVLDEGVNIPQIEKAFILASTTVERQWIQRRGRLLRTCSEIGKTHSEIHDFITLPPDLENVDDDAKSLIKSELSRVQEFANLARNAGRKDGPLEVIHEMVKAAYF